VVETELDVQGLGGLELRVTLLLLVFLVFVSLGFFQKSLFLLFVTLWGVLGK